MYNLLPKPPYNAKQLQRNSNITWVKSSEFKTQFFWGVAYSTVQNKCRVTIENMAIAIVTYILFLVLYLCYAPHINVLTSQNGILNSTDKWPM